MERTLERNVTEFPNTHIVLQETASRFSIPDVYQYRSQPSISETEVLKRLHGIERVVAENQEFIKQIVPAILKENQSIMARLEATQVILANTQMLLHEALGKSQCCSPETTKEEEETCEPQEHDADNGVTLVPETDELSEVHYTPDWANFSVLPTHSDLPTEIDAELEQLGWEQFVDKDRFPSIRHVKWNTALLNSVKCGQPFGARQLANLFGGDELDYKIILELKTKKGADKNPSSKLKDLARHILGEPTDQLMSKLHLKERLSGTNGGRIALAVRIALANVMVHNFKTDYRVGMRVVRMLKLHRCKSNTQHHIHSLQ